ncbi:RNase H1/viroplasmin domain-containing protein [Geopseudomonas aromaticivorans]
MTRTKFYAVARGTVPGIYESWAEAEQQVSGFPGARHRSFRTRDDAEEWLQEQQGAIPKDPDMPDQGFAVTVMAMPHGGTADDVILVGTNVFEAASADEARDMGKREFWTDSLEQGHAPIIEVIPFGDEPSAAPAEDDCAPW